MEGGSIQTNTIKKIPPQKIEERGNFEIRLREFLEKNTFNLEIPERKESVDTVKNSSSKKNLDDYVIASDLLLSTETSKIALAYKDGNNQLLVVKEKLEKKMNELLRLNNLGSMTVEEYLKEKGFNDPNVLLPIKTIKKDGKIYRFYEAMDMDLEKYLENHNKLPIKEGISLILRACQGVEALHKAGVVNVDFAPLNIMLTSINLRLIDLGCAAIDRNDGNVLSRNFAGTNRFTSAPELFEDRPHFDKTVDIYAVASTLYRLIVGNWPYNIEKQTKDLPYEEKMSAYKKLHEENNINFPDFIPVDIQRVIKKGMNSTPKDRYQSMQEFMSELMDAGEKQVERKELKRNEKNDDSSYAINNQRLELFFERFSTNEQKIEVLNELLEMHLNDEILQKLNLDTSIEKIKEQFQQCKDIDNPAEFIKRIHAILKPIDIARKKHPEVFAKIERKIFIESHPSFIPLNEILLYRIDDGDLHLHLAPAADFGTSKKISLTKDAFEKLLKIISSDKEIREVSATSWIVANSPKLFIRMGFKIQGPISKETRKIDFESETRPISRATMSRRDFLDKYSKKGNFVRFIKS